MTEPTAIHATLTLDRLYDAAPGRVFAAWADPGARARWGAPTPRHEIVFLETDFRVGGRDFSCCGLVGDPSIAVEARYEDIVEGRRIVFTETVLHQGVRLSVSLVTVLLQVEGLATRLTLTCQITALDGSDMAAGARSGWTAALGNLAAELTREAA
ncbi:SRPBCC family protein [Caulobacter mirabilis]|uniref:ATPase n=1 Tax=Caulobacter mirabilis TaxID=69666 RepID=A0A2D2AUC3_9CAUL|nr:SRPBCC family protein [Caulobacter mirabilis]ATQ41591.1 ATPase [Caulobacter mirabilis]